MRSPSQTVTEETPISGYANRVLTLTFPELSEDDDLIYVVLHNPKMRAPKKLRPAELPEIGEDGQPVDEEAAERAGFEVMAAQILGWHVYAADDDQQIEIGPDGEPVAMPDQEPLPWPATAENVARLPNVILHRISEAMQEAVNPQ